jgi:hypothetical protein
MLRHISSSSGCKQPAPALAFHGNLTRAAPIAIGAFAVWRGKDRGGFRVGPNFARQVGHSCAEIAQKCSAGINPA